MDELVEEHRIKHPLDDLRSDFVAEVREVCRLRLAQDLATRDAEIMERAHAPDGSQLNHLVVSYARGPWEERLVVGVQDGAVNAELLERFRRLVCAPQRVERAEIVQRSPDLPPEVAAAAAESRIWVRIWDDYQRVWDDSRYVARQNADLRDDLAYPLNLHIDKRWALLGDEKPQNATASQQILEWLGTDGPRFVLVLGDFGTGKTFLLHALADQIPRMRGLVPVLVTMRDLEKGRTLDELLAQHMNRYDEDPFHMASFRYLLRRGRVALLFDGFDELALRTSFERVPHHFATLRQAAEGVAKVVVTSRHQYFATDSAVRTALGQEITDLAGSRIIKLFPLDPGQRRDMVVSAFGGDVAEADRFLDILGRVRGLLGLAANARMLGFLIRWFRDGVLTEDTIIGADGTEPMSRGKLYELLLTRWLEHELRRQSAAGSYLALDVEQRFAALGELAQRLWDAGERSIHPAELGELADKVADLAALDMRRGEVAHAVASSTVLVRRADDEFAFIHQSVLEWFVAWRAAMALNAGRGDDALAHREASGVVVDFLRDLAGTAPMLAWARRIAATRDAPGSAAKANAALILQHLSASAATVDYSGQDLRGRDLSNQDMTNAQLSEADLSGTVLPTALRGADLRGARLVAARLHRADLTAANLTRANLSQALLMGADLRSAVLDETTFDRAALFGATLDPDALSTASIFGTALPDSQLLPNTGSVGPTRALLTMQAGKLLIRAEGSVIAISDSASGRELRTLTGHTGPVWALAAAPDGSWLASAGDDALIRIWDPTTGRNLLTLAGHTGPVRTLAVAPKGSWLASAGLDKTVRLWDPTTGRELHKLSGHTSPVWALVIAPNGSWLASTGDDTTVQLWEPTAGRKLQTLTGHRGPAWALAVAPRGSWLASAGFDNTVRLWDPITGRQLRTLNGHTGPVRALAAAPDGSWLASAGDDEVVRLWVPTTGRRLRTLNGHTGPVRALAAASDGSWLASTDEKTVRLWSPATGRELRILNGYSSPVLTLCAAPNGSWLASADDKTLRLWSPTTGRESHILNGHTGPIWAMAVAPDGSWLASASNGTVRLWSPTTGRERTLRGQTTSVRALAAAPNGSWLASGGPDVALQLWDPTNGRKLRTLTSQAGPVWALAVAPDGSWLASAGDGSVRLWSPTTGAKLRALTGHAGPVRALAVAPDGSWLASAGFDKTIRLWDPTVAGKPRTLRGHAGSVRAMAVAPDGSWLASTGDDATIRLWDPSNHHELRTLTGHTGSIGALSVAPDGSWLASASSDNTVRLWDPRTGRELATLLGDSEGWAILLSDGSYKLRGNPAGVWWVGGLVRFDPRELAEIAEFQPRLTKLDDDIPILV